MRIAYVISACKNPNHLSRLVHRLHGLETRFAMHLDGKTDTHVYDAMQEGLGDLDEVTFLPRHACHSGGFGQVRASLTRLGRASADVEIAA